MIRSHGDIAGVLRERPLRAPDREYLQAAITVVRPVDDLPVPLPPGQRDAYPTNEPALWALAAHHHAEDSVGRLLSALTSLAAQRPRPQRRGEGRSRRALTTRAHLGQRPDPLLRALRARVNRCDDDDTRSSVRRWHRRRRGCPSAQVSLSTTPELQRRPARRTLVRRTSCTLWRLLNQSLFRTCSLAHRRGRQRSMRCSATRRMPWFASMSAGRGACRHGRGWLSCARSWAEPVRLPLALSAHRLKDC
jgi:hypothetical protein